MIIRNSKRDSYQIHDRGIDHGRGYSSIANSIGINADNIRKI